MDRGVFSGRMGAYTRQAKRGTSGCLLPKVPTKKRLETRSRNPFSVSFTSRNLDFYVDTLSFIFLSVQNFVSLVPTLPAMKVLVHVGQLRERRLVP